MARIPTRRAAAALVLLGACLVRTAEARVNATSALNVFLISDCATCTADKNSIFCSEAKGGDTDNWVRNSTLKITIKDKKTQAKYNLGNDQVPLGAADGAKFCWEGTFPKLKNNVGHFDEIMGEANVTVSLECSQTNLFYRQCVMPAEMSIILMAVGSILAVGGTTLVLFCCGCCKCCNEKGDESKWGMCNRFCPWCTLCADKHLRQEEVKVELTEERSLTGKSSKLNSAYGKSMADKAPGTTSMVNPMLARRPGREDV